MADKPARADKVASVTELTDKFRSSAATVLTEYRGLTMSQMTSLRRTLGRESTYTVVKNTLTRWAADEAGISGLEDLLTGPTAIVFVGGDPVEAARGLRDFARTNPLLVIKGGTLEGKLLSADEVRRLADLESREVLLAKLAGAMKGNLSKAAGLFQAPLSQVARLAAALQDKRAAGAPADPAPSDAPASSDPASSDPASTDTTPSDTTPSGTPPESAPAASDAPPHEAGAEPAAVDA